MSTRNGRRGQTESRRGTIRVGTASWTDPGFIADWYPPDLPAGDRLAWYAEHFDLVEVNASFYTVLDDTTVARWAEQTPADFVFDVKLHRLLSRHSTPVKFLPAGLRPLATVRGTKVELTPKLETSLAKLFLAGIEPLRAAGKLGALLLQLSPAFSPREYFLTELDHLLGLLEEYLVAVELRNRGWLSAERGEETVAYFKQRRVTLISVDAPESEHFTVMPAADFVTDPRLAYLRAHGRNTHGYISGRKVADRFDYDYSTAEVKQIAKRAEQMANIAGTTHIIFNNNKSSYAPRAAELFSQVIKRSGDRVST